MKFTQMIAVRNIPLAQHVPSIPTWRNNVTFFFRVSCYCCLHMYICKYTIIYSAYVYMYIYYYILRIGHKGIRIIRWLHTKHDQAICGSLGTLT